MDNCSICLRDFEERDVDFIYKCKNDDSLNEMIVGQSPKFTNEDARKWVDGCIGEHETYKFWAICTNDRERKIIGWISLSNIDKMNNSICHHGIVIGDNSYKDGIAMFEAMLLSMNYAFNTLKTHRLYGYCLSEHKTSPHMLNALGFTLEGTRREAVFKNNRYYDILDFALLEEDYNSNIKNNLYKMNALIKKFVKSLKSNR